MSFFDEIVAADATKTRKTSKGQGFYGKFVGLNKVDQSGNYFIDDNALKARALAALKARSANVEKENVSYANTLLKIITQKNNYMNQMLTEQMQIVNSISDKLMALARKLFKGYTKQQLPELTIEGRTAKKGDDGEYHYERKNGELYKNKVDKTKVNQVLKVEAFKNNRTDSSIQQLKDSVKELKSFVKSNNIHGTMIDSFLKSAHSFTPENMVQIISNYNNVKGEMLEELGNRWLTSFFGTDTGYRVVSTGRFYDSTTDEQIIQDLIVYNVSTQAGQVIDRILQGVSNIGSKTGSTVIKVSTSDLTQALKDANGVAFGIQAKAGRDQKLWNDSVKFSLSALAQESTYLSLLGQLASTPWGQKKDKWKDEVTWNDSSATVARIALDTAVTFDTFVEQLYHYSNGGNQIVLTNEGFETFEDRMDKLLVTQNLSTNPSAIPLGANLMSQQIEILLGGR